MKRFPSLNGLRSISILLVLLNHLSIQYGIFDNLLHYRWLVQVIVFFSDGQLGVNIFFVISGFLITSLLLIEEEKSLKISFKNFYIRRVLRIFPAYYLLLLFYFILQLFGRITIPYEGWLTAISYTKYFLNTEFYTSHAWTLSVEEHFYFFWPVCFVAGDKFRKKIALSLILIVPIIRVIYYHYLGVGWKCENTLFTRIDAISMGCLFALYKEEILGFLSRNWSIYLYSSIVLLFSLYHLPVIANELHVGFLFVPFGGTHGSFANIFIAIIMMYSVFGPQKTWYRFLNFPLLNWLGMLSYSIYLWQQFFINNTKSWFNLFPLNIVLLLIVATISFYFIEKPFLGLKNKFSNK